MRSFEEQLGYEDMCLTSGLHTTSFHKLKEHYWAKKIVHGRKISIIISSNRCCHCNTDFLTDQAELGNRSLITLNDYYSNLFQTCGNQLILPVNLSNHFYTVLRPGQWTHTWTNSSCLDRQISTVFMVTADVLNIFQKPNPVNQFPWRDKNRTDPDHLSINNQQKQICSVLPRCVYRPQAFTQKVKLTNGLKKRKPNLLL